MRADSQVLDLAGPSFKVPRTLSGAVDCKILSSIHPPARRGTLVPHPVEENKTLLADNERAARLRR